MKIICKLYHLQTLLLESCYLKEIPHEIENLVRHLTLSQNKSLKELPDNMFNLNELQTLLLRGCSLREIPLKIANLVQLRHIDLSRNEGLKVLPKSMYSLDKLRTLLLRGCSLKEISMEIGNLVELRHLDLSSNSELEELPRNIFKLKRLHTLLLDRCSLKEIPCEIGNLVKLRHLDLSWNKKLKELPESMCKLVELQTLTMQGCGNCRLPEGLANLNGIRLLKGFCGGSGFNRFELLKNLSSLSGHFRFFISITSNSSKELVEDAREAELKEKEHLHTVEFQFINERNDDQGECSSSPSLWVDVIEALEPHQNLQHLRIFAYQGWRLPDWISSPFNLVREIRLYDCPELLSLPPMGNLPFLKKLEMEKMKELKVVGVEWLGIRGREGEMMDIQSSSAVVAFPELKELTFDNCPKWWKWEDITEQEEESSAVSVMPCLTNLNLYGCDGLSMMPHRLLYKILSLQSLKIKDYPYSIPIVYKEGWSPSNRI